MLAYAAASHGWRVMPLSLADWAWQRRGRSLLARATRSVPAYNTLLRIFGNATDPARPLAANPHLQTCRRSYVQVFPLQQRCRSGRQGQAVAVEATGAPDEGWPRGRDELQVLREQLVDVLTGWFDAGARRTLLVPALPETGWSSRRRIEQALQSAIAAGYLRGCVRDIPDGRSPESALRAANGFDQCVVLADPARAVEQAAWLGQWKGRAGIVVFGPLAAGATAGFSQQIRVCSVRGADEVGPLIAAETPLSRMVLDACRRSATARNELLPDGFVPTAIYQPLPRGPWIQQEAGQLLVSSWGAAPVVRYRVGWRGQVVSFAWLCEVLRDAEVLPPRHLKRLTRIESICWKLPLIALVDA